MLLLLLLLNRASPGCGCAMGRSEMRSTAAGPPRACTMCLHIKKFLSMQPCQGSQPGKGGAPDVGDGKRDGLM